MVEMRKLVWRSRPPPLQPPRHCLSALWTYRAPNLSIMCHTTEVKRDRWCSRGTCVCVRVWCVCVHSKLLSKHKFDTRRCTLYNSSLVPLVYIFLLLLELWYTVCTPVWLVHMKISALWAATRTAAGLLEVPLIRVGYCCVCRCHFSSSIFQVKTDAGNYFWGFVLLASFAKATSYILVWYRIWIPTYLGKPLVCDLPPVSTRADSPTDLPKGVDLSPE